MDGHRSICPCHPDENRDPRFAVLDSLIRAGWGSVPMHLIDHVIDQNGGVLPPGPGLQAGTNGATDGGAE